MPCSVRTRSVAGLQPGPEPPLEGSVRETLSTLVLWRGCCASLPSKWHSSRVSSRCRPYRAVPLVQLARSALQCSFDAPLFHAAAVACVCCPSCCSTVTGSCHCLQRARAQVAVPPRGISRLPRARGRLPPELCFVGPTGFGPTRYGRSGPPSGLRVQRQRCAASPHRCDPLGSPAPNCRPR